MAEKKYYLGIDLGGTMIKGGIIDRSGKIYYSTSIPTEVPKGEDGIIGNIVKLCELILKESKIDKNEVVGVGIGSPGIIDSKNGVVIFATNMRFEKTKMCEKVTGLLGLPSKLTNDANAAALGEATFGVGSQYQNSIFITLGTGVGGGVIIENKLFEGYMGCGTEIGHDVIEVGGRQCGCGRRGCFEAYSSATALIKRTKEEMEKNKDSKMWTVCGGDINKVDGKTAFDCQETDETAKAVVEEYVSYLAEAITNLCNVFRPEVIMLGGGVANQGDNLVIPLQKKVDAMVFGGSRLPQVKILKATRKNDAGFLGAAALFM